MFFLRTKCFTHCILESMNMMRKGKLNADLAIRQIKMYMPPGMQDEWVIGIEACRNNGEKI